MNKKEIITNLGREIKSFDRQRESAQNFGWPGREANASFNLDFFQSIYKLIAGEKWQKK